MATSSKYNDSISRDGDDNDTISLNESYGSDWTDPHPLARGTLKKRSVHGESGSGYGLTVKIPKLIMQTWKNKQVPDAWKPSVESILEYQPDWEYVLMTDSDNRQFVIDHFPQYLMTYDSFPYMIQRVDMIRYMWLYVKGGIYMDLDYVLNRPLDPLFYNDAELYVIKSANFKTSFTNSFLASKPGCRFWLEVLEEIRKRAVNGKWWAKGKYFEVMTTTGPMMLSDVLKETKTPYITLPPNLVNSINICSSAKGTLKGQGQTDTYLAPLEGCSWGSWDLRLGNWCYCNWNWIYWLLFLVVILLVLLFIFLAVSYWKNRKLDMVELNSVQVDQFDGKKTYRYTVK